MKSFWGLVFVGVAPAMFKRAEQYRHVGFKILFRDLSAVILCKLHFLSELARSLSDFE
jgi:hypothetical protein